MNMLPKIGSPRAWITKVHLAAKTLGSRRSRYSISRAAGLWAAFLVSMTLSCGLLGAAVFSAYRDHQQTADLGNALNLLQETSTSQTRDGAAPAPSDFSAHLGSSTSSTAFLSALVQAASDANVQIVNLSVARQAATVADLGRQEFSVALRGAYAGHKLLLNEVLARFKNASVRALRLRREPTGTVESAVTFSLWSAPLIQEAKPDGGTVRVGR